METPIIAALIAASVSIIGLIVSHQLSKKKEIEARQAQAALRHLERQIEELYGPLEGLLTYRNTVYQLEQERKRLRPADQAGRDPNVIRYFIENHYIPLNQQIITLLRTKAHLMVGNETPESFKQYLKQAASLECMHNLWCNTGLDSFFVPGYEWKDDFPNEVRQTLQSLRNRHAQLIKDVTGRA